MANLIVIGLWNTLNIIRLRPVYVFKIGYILNNSNSYQNFVLHV